MGEISLRITQSTQVNFVTNIKLTYDFLQFLVINGSILVFNQIPATSILFSITFSTDSASALRL